MKAKSLITKNGYSKLVKELQILKNEKRVEVIEAIEKAREHGDLSENAEYHAAKEQQKLIEGKISILQQQVLNAEIIDNSKLTTDRIHFGSTVLLKNLGTEQKVQYTIVGDYEANIKQNTISVVSPIAKSLVGKKVNDQVEVLLPNGLKSKYQILNIQFLMND